MDKRYFSLEDANEMIPRLEAAFLRMQQMRQHIRVLWRRLEDADWAPSEDEFDIAPDDAPFGVIQDRATLKALVEATRDQLDNLQDEGCVVKGIEPGLVDWYAKRQGRDVFLCWKLGEKEVEGWHELHNGFSTRRPIAEFLEPELATEDAQ